MVVTLNGVRSLRRYRLVIAQKSKLRLTQEVTAALASHSRDHRFTASSFFPCSIVGEYLYGYAGDGYRSPLWLWLPTMALRFLSTGSEAARCIFIKPPKTGGYCSYQVSTILMLNDCNHCHCRLQVHMRESPLVGPEGAGETVEDPSSEEELPLMVNLRLRRK